MGKSNKRTKHTKEDELYLSSSDNESELTSDYDSDNESYNESESYNENESESYSDNESYCDNESYNESESYSDNDSDNDSENESENEDNNEEEEENENIILNQLISSYTYDKKPISDCYKELEQFKIKHFIGSYKNDKNNKCVMDKDFIRINKYDNKEKNDGLFKFNDKIYLMILRVGKIQELRGKLFIEKDEYIKFLGLINNIVNHPLFDYDYNKYHLNYLERLPPVCPLLIDVDLKYKIKKDFRIYDIIKDDVICECQNILKENYNIKNPLYYLFEKKEATQKDNNIYKDGFHLGFYYPFNHNEYDLIYKELRNRIKNKKSFKKLLENNKDIEDTNINEIIDNCMTNNQAYMMYLNTKYEKNNFEYSPYYKLTYTNDKNYEKNKIYSVFMFSNYQFYITNTPALKLIKEFNIIDIDDIKEKTKEKTKEKEIINENDENDDNNDNIENIINKDNKNLTLDKVKKINSNYKIEDIRRFIDILDLKYSEEENDWFKIYYSIYSYKEVYPELLNEIKDEMDYFSLKSRKKYSKNDNENILKNYQKGKISLNCLINYSFKSNKDEATKIFKEIKQRNNKNQLIHYEDINEIQKIKYNIIFEKESNFNPYKFDKLFEKNIIEAIKYFYQYYIYVGCDTFYKLIFKYEYERKIFEFQEIKCIKNLDLNLKKELTDKEREFIINYNEFGYHRIKNAIKKEKKDKYTISFYNLLETTKTFFTSTIINDITQDLYYGIKGLNQYNIQISNNLYFNENNLKRCLYFDDILNTNIEVKENNKYLLFFKNYIDNHILKRNDNDNDYNLIEQKRFYIYNYLKTIFNFKKNHTCLILLGGQGSLKSTFGKMIIKCLGDKIARSLTGSEFLNESYNGSILEDNLFLQLEELKVAENGFQHNDMINNLKNLITADTTRIRKILKNPSFHKTFISYLITSNYNCPLKISYDDRRYCVFEINNKNKDDKFITELNNLFDNKEALIILYNYFKNTNFTCQCKDKNCIYHNMEKPFEYLDGILTPEKMKIIQGTSNIFEQFLVDFYYQIKYDIAYNKMLNNKKYIIYNNDNIDNSKFNITITKFYGEFKSYLDMKKINKIPKKKIFSQSLIEGLFKESSLDHTEIMNISISEYRKLLFNNHIIDDKDDYIFLDNENNFINEGNFKPFNNLLIKKEIIF